MELKWEYCATCKVMTIICPECGNNVCNGGSGIMNGNEKCTICDLAHQYMKLAYTTNKVPDFPNDKEKLDQKNQEFFNNLKK